MKKDMLFRDLVQLDLEAADQTEVFKRLADILFKKGFVKETYLDSLKVREERYPTALPIKPYPVAIPHTDISQIIRPFIAPVRLKEAVEWREMANNDEVHQVRFVFMLGFLKSDEHIDLLQILVENFQNEELMEHLNNAKTADEYFELVCGIKGMES
ncbi:PTS sugar transporter subunit IIA [Lacrimispora sp.]|uniref:PTS sugar transporter subunit IIA n=1 Tax=Lacrimispora sp. TaxID=2719234 RepID=UPI0028A95E9F|nr:PTS sugar transporter subunit IIA [Lacrimispora sp.]